MKFHNHFIHCFKQIIPVILLLAFLMSNTVFAQTSKSGYSSSETKPSISAYLVLNRNTVYQLNPTINGVTADTSDYTYSSSNKRVAQVDSSGLVTTNKKGSTRITITSKSNPSLSCTTRLYVGKKITKIRLTTTKKDIMSGNYFMLKAKLSPGSAAFKKLEYTSSNTNVAKVSSKGKVTGVAPGTATITVRTLDGSNLSKTCTVTVLKESDSDDENTSIFPNPFFRNEVNNNKSGTASEAIPADEKTEVTDTEQ